MSEEDNKKLIEENIVLHNDWNKIEEELKSIINYYAINKNGHKMRIYQDILNKMKEMRESEKHEI